MDCKQHAGEADPTRERMLICHEATASPDTQTSTLGNKEKEETS